MIKLGKQNKALSRNFAWYSRRFTSIIFPVLMLLMFPSMMEAANLYLEPSSGEYQPGDTFLVEVRIDTEGECINTVSADLSFSQDILEAIEFSQGNSILTIWLKKPEILQESGLISFIGGIPGGYCGILAGDPGKNYILGRIIFRVVSREVPRGLARVVFRDDSQVLLNDGLGTPAKLITKGAVFNISPEPFDATQGRNEWQEEIGKDNIPPESFKIEIHQDPAIFEGKYFIVFSTTDKQTGLDYYEILEADERGYQRGTTRKAEWKKGDSPYLLEDQGLKSIIKVKAVDKAGNERITEYLPPEKPFSYWIIVLTLIGMGAIWWIIRKFRYGKK